MSKIDRTNEKSISKDGCLMKIIQYINAANVIVEFQDEHKAKVHTRYDHFKNGKVKNPFIPSVRNVAYIGNATTKENGNDKHSYRTWLSMIARCYDEKYHQKYPTYKECEVCEKWLCYENFEKWYNQNYYKINDEKMCLDKDILIKGNKTYSPDTCVFVPENINKLFVKGNGLRGDLPIGVSYGKSAEYYRPQCSKNGKSIHLGSFTNLIDAFNAYKMYKENLIRQTANNYKNKIPENLYNSLMNYKVEITD